MPRTHDIPDPRHTTALAYTVGEAHPFRERRSRLWIAHGEGLIEAATTNRSYRGIRATALVSADRSFGSIPDLTWVDPGSPALRDLLAGGAQGGLR